MNIPQNVRPKENYIIVLSIVSPLTRTANKSISLAKTTKAKACGPVICFLVENFPKNFNSQIKETYSVTNSLAFWGGNSQKIWEKKIYRKFWITSMQFLVFRQFFNSLDNFFQTMATINSKFILGWLLMMLHQKLAESKTMI